MRDWNRVARSLAERLRAHEQQKARLAEQEAKLKDAGRFVFIDRVKKNPSFLPYFEPSLAKVRAALGRLQDEEDMRALAEIVARA